MAILSKRAKAVFQLRIRVSLEDIGPPIWRSIQVPDDTKLSKPHRVLQLLFNWEDYHLHDWRHEVLLKAILLPPAGVFYPPCAAGSRNGPPEDAGG